MKNKVFQRKEHKDLYYANTSLDTLVLVYYSQGKEKHGCVVS